MPAENLVIIRTLDDLETLGAYLDGLDSTTPLAFDTETDGVEKDSHIIGFSISSDTDTGFYVVLSAWDPKAKRLIDLETKAAAKAILDRLIGRPLVMHNALFDCWMVANNFGVDLMPSVHTDTMLLAHLLDENRRVGLKELAVSIFGEDSKREQTEMKESVYRNGGVLTKERYELYKADADLIAKYGAKDTILTLKLFYHLVPDLFEQNLDKFFYDDETMPLLRSATYDLNTTGLRVDPEKLDKLRRELEAECLEAKAFILKEVEPHVKRKYPGTGKTNHFNIGASQQLAWLLFFELGNEFISLTDGGRDLCKALQLKLPYTAAAKRAFISAVTESKGRIWDEAKFNPKTSKMGRPKKIGDPWTYMAIGKQTLSRYKDRYKWVSKLLEYKKAEKLLSTYVLGIQSQMKYNIIRPQFLQHGTKTGRYSSKSPNFQNLPRDDKRVKACIVSRPGKVFIGADYAQLEPRVFASFSGDERLLRCFRDGDDFYSVVGAPVFGKTDCTLKKDGSAASFPVKYIKLRDVAKVIALAIPYGTTAPQLAREIEIKAGLSISLDEAQEIIDDYFAAYPSVHKHMLSRHEEAKRNGVVHNLFGRPRHIPEAKSILSIYGKTSHDRLPKEARTWLNSSMNSPIQGTGASLINRALIAFRSACVENGKADPAWLEVRVVMQVHDEGIAESPEGISVAVAALLKRCMEETNTLPGVDLIANPVIAKNLADLK